MKKVAVVFGGSSCEREVSIISGTMACNVLRGGRFDILPVYFDEGGRAYTAKSFFEVATFRKAEFLKKAKRVTFSDGALYEIEPNGKRWKRLCAIDCVLNCCHGGLGEGGGVSALAELQGIPLASPSVAPSAVCLDKSLTKVFAKGLGIPVVDGMRVRERDYRKRGAFLLKNIERRLKFPVIVKPCKLGSSIGIAVAKDCEELKDALATAFELDDCVVIEKFLVDKKDVNCGAYSLGGEVFVSEAETAFSSSDGVYGFEDKYLRKKQNEGGRCLLTGAVRQKIRGYTKTLYRRMNMSGVVRMDYLVQGEKVYLSEVNTVPGSLAYYLFCDRLSEARAFFENLIDDGLERAETARKALVTTGVLDTAVK